MLVAVGYETHVSSKYFVAIASTTTTTQLPCNHTCLNQSWTSSSDLIAFWSFDGHFNESINNYNGYSVGNLPAFDTGYFGQAALFNSSNLETVYAPFRSLNHTSFTVELWIKPTGFPNSVDHSLIGLCSASSTSRCLHMNIRNGKLYLGFFSNDLAASTHVSINTWSHVSFIFELNTLKQMIYLNGKIDGQRVASSHLQTDNENITFGKNERVASSSGYYQVGHYFYTLALLFIIRYQS